MASQKRRRILIAKPGLDGHDRGAKIIARALRDAGHEVIYTGLHQTPEMVVLTAAQEDVDAIGLSILSGAHLHLVKEIMQQIKKNKMTHVRVLVGGIIPEADQGVLKKLGVKAIFTPGAPLDKILKTFEG